MKYWFSSILVALILIPVSVFAASPSTSTTTTGTTTARSAIPEQEYVSTINYSLEQPFGGKGSVETIGEYIQLVYQFALGIVGIFAVVLIMYGGLRWVAAAGNESTIGEAKEVITSAVIGLVIALLSYVILLAINPNLVKTVQGVPKIGIPDKASIWENAACTSNAFKSETCTLTTGSNGSCSAAQCDDVAVNPTSSTVCRGTVCTEPGEICSHDPRDINRASCQQTQCGDWADSCASKFEKDSIKYRECLCGFYSDNVMVQSFGSQIASLSGQLILYPSGTAPADVAAVEAQGLEVFKTICSESRTETDLESLVGNTSPYKDLYKDKANPAGIPSKAWNCNFSCQYHFYDNIFLDYHSCVPK